MNSTQSNVVVLVRIAGNVLCCVRDGEAVRVRKVGVFTVKPPDQTEALALLREEGDGVVGGDAKLGSELLLERR